MTALRRGSIGFVFQSFHLLPELSGFENMLSPEQIQAIVDYERGL